MPQPPALWMRLVEAFDKQPQPLTIDEICKLPELDMYVGKYRRTRIIESSRRMAEAGYLKFEDGKFSRGTRPILWRRLASCEQ